MSSTWPRVRIGDVATFLSGGTPKKSAAEFWGGDIPWISGATMHVTRLRSSDRCVTPVGAENGTRLAPAGATLVLVRGMSLHSEVRVGHTMRALTFNQDIKGLVPKASIDPWFLTYVLRAHEPTMLGMVHSAGHGTGVLATDRLKSFEFGLPTLEEQQRITAVLNGLDDMIEVNQGLARNLYALSDGLGEKLLAGLGATERVQMTDLAEITNGYSYKSAELTPGDGWLVNLKNVGRDGTFQARGFKPLTADVKPSQVVDSGDILVARTDLTQTRDVVGRPVRVRRGHFEGRLVASLDLAIVRPKAGISPEFLFAVLKSEDFRMHAHAYCNGTTVVHMASAAIPSYLAPRPTEVKIVNFEQTVKPLIAEAEAAETEAERLIEIRDELLLLLVSGRVSPQEIGA